MSQSAPEVNESDASPGAVSPDGRPVDASDNTGRARLVLSTILGVLWVYCTNKWSSVRPDVGFWSESLMQRIFARRSVFLFFLVVFLPALIEEICWDASTWHVYLPFEDLQLSDSWSSLWVALLSVPQIVHYWTDIFIWKFNRSNPDLKHNLGL